MLQTSVLWIQRKSDTEYNMTNETQTGDNKLAQHSDSIQKPG